MENIDVNIDGLKNNIDTLNQVQNNYSSLCNSINDKFNSISSSWECELKEKYYSEVQEMNKILEIGKIMIDSTISNLNKTIINYYKTEIKLESDTDGL